MGRGGVLGWNGDMNGLTNSAIVSLRDVSKVYGSGDSALASRVGRCAYTLAVLMVIPVLNTVGGPREQARA